MSGVELGATAVGESARATDAAPLPLPLHVALVVALGVAFGALVGRLAMLRASAVVDRSARSLFRQSRTGSSRATTFGCRSSCRCSCSCRLAFGVAVWWNYRELAAQRERVRTALGYYVPHVARRDG